jgi:hypothetical protein
MLLWILLALGTLAPRLGACVGLRVCGFAGLCVPACVAGVGGVRWSPCGGALVQLGPRRCRSAASVSGRGRSLHYGLVSCLLLEPWAPAPAAEQVRPFHRRPHPARITFPPPSPSTCALFYTVARERDGVVLWWWFPCWSSWYRKN